MRQFTSAICYTRRRGGELSSLGARFSGLRGRKISGLLALRGWMMAVAG